MRVAATALRSSSIHFGIQEDFGTRCNLQRPVTMLRASHLLPAIEVQARRAGTQATVFITIAYRPPLKRPIYQWAARPIEHYRLSTGAFMTLHNDPGVVVITGASSGIGRATAQ